MSSSLQRPPSLQPSQPSLSKPMQHPNNLPLQSHITLSSPFLSSILAVHLLYFSIHTLSLPLHLMILMLTSLSAFTLAITLFNSSAQAQIRKLTLFILYPLTTSLSSTFLSVFFNCQDYSQADVFQLMISTTMSALTLILVVHLKGRHVTSEENPKKTIQSLQTEKDQALKNIEEQKFLTTMLCHESRNILNCLINTFHFLDFDLNPGTIDLSKAKKDLLGGKYCCETLLNYFNNYLDSGKALQTQQESSDLPELFQKVKEIAKSALKFKGLESKFTTEDNIPTNISLNETSVLQILLNLIYNSIKFTDKGSVEVDVQWQAQMFPSQASLSAISPSSANSNLKIGTLNHLSTSSTVAELTRGKGLVSLPNKKTIRPAHQYGKLILKVTDTGCGMSQDDISMLFQPFSQPNSDPKKRRQGSGLGLWLTKTMVEKLGGEIKVVSQLGKGTTFTAIIECQGTFADKDVSKDMSLEKLTLSKLSKSEGAGHKAVILGQNTMENMVIKTYMKNHGFEMINEAIDLKDLWQYLDKHSQEDTIVVLSEKYTEGLNSLYRWDNGLLRNKFVMIIEDPVQDTKTQCIIDGSQLLESPVRYNDFSKALLANPNKL